MFSHISILSIFYVLVDVVLIDVARCEFLLLHANTTGHDLGRESDRSIRSPPEVLPFKLKMMIRYPTNEIENLVLLRDDGYLANEYLPVIISGHENKKVMKDVGEFSTYQDVTRCAAVIYFKKFNVFYGVIGLKYAITNLPNAFDATGLHPGVIGAPYITTRPVDLGHDTVQLSGTNVIEQLNCPSGSGPIESEPGPSRKRPRLQRAVDEANGNITNSDVPMIRKRRAGKCRQEYYLEILVFVTKDVVEFFKELYGPEIHIEWLVRFYILHFNAVDMIFQRIEFSRLRLKLNIAKIVIEDETRPFNFINDGDLHLTETIPKLREYLRDERYIYTADSFDHVFISTRRQIWNGLLSVQGTTDIGGDMYIAREVSKLYAAIPITAVGFDYDYVVTVREISRSLGITTTPNFAGQCDGIMGESDSKCENCVQWSSKNRDQLEVFLRMNRNRCFLLNKPRSIYPGPYNLISPIKQCQCFGYESYNPEDNGRSRSKLRVYECNLPLVCANHIGDRISRIETLEPRDGTSCGGSMVCWNGHCTPVRLHPVMTEHV